MTTKVSAGALGSTLVGAHAGRGDGGCARLSIGRRVSRVSRSESLSEEATREARVRVPARALRGGWRAVRLARRWPSRRESN